MPETLKRSHVKRDTAQARAYSQAVITEGGRTIWLAGLLALSLSACVDTRSAHTNGNGGNANPPDSLDHVLSRTFTT